MSPQGPRRLLTFRLDQERRQRLRARLAREGRTMSEVVTHGLRQYVQHARHRDERGHCDERADGAGPGDGAGRLVLPERIAARLRELRSSGRSELLSVTLAALHEAGWPLRPLAEALGISKQAVQARVRRRAAARRPGSLTARPEVASELGVHELGVASELRVSEMGVASELMVACEPPPPFPQRRVASPAGLRPHLTIKIDHALRASAHRVAADEGHSLTQVVEGILDHYLRQGMADRDADGDQAPRETSRAASRSR